LEKPAIELPKLSIEAAFAASNTNIIVKGDHTWLVSGGLKSAYFTPNKGKTWSTYDTHNSRKSNDRNFYS
jgi:hypothetical protein